jgi:hypothetical protein
MFRRSTVRVSALHCMLLLSSGCAFGSDATGVLHRTCDLAYQYLLDLTTFQGHRLQKTIEFQVLGEIGFQLYANQWVDSRGPEGATFSQIQIVQLSHHW